MHDLYMLLIFVTKSCSELSEGFSTRTVRVRYGKKTRAEGADDMKVAFLEGARLQTEKEPRGRFLILVM